MLDQVQMRFDAPAEDHGRLRGQMLRVYKAMSDGQWHTLDEICVATGERRDASVSARLRDLRKDRFGGFTVERRRRSSGTYEYRMGGAA